LNSLIFPDGGILVSETFGGGKRMARKGAKYKCEKCGVAVVVDEACGCVACDLICCGVPMKEVKPKAKK